MGDYLIVELPELPDEKNEFPFMLRLQHSSIPDYRFIEQVAMVFRIRALELKGRYEGWACDALR
jgi:hypothetical protein